MNNMQKGSFVKSDQLVGDPPMKNLRRKSVTPKIVVCPPTEMTEPTPAPRGARLLHALSRRLTRRAADASSLASSSSSDSVTCDPSRAASDDHSSCSASESDSDSSEHPRRHRSTVSLRRVFQSLSLTSRSLSCSPIERQRQSKKQTQPKRILRSPVTYTYVCGLSGLPTQRVPRHAVYCPASGLHR